MVSEDSGCCTRLQDVGAMSKYGINASIMIVLYCSPTVLLSRNPLISIVVISEGEGVVALAGWIDLFGGGT